MKKLRFGLIAKVMIGVGIVVGLLGTVGSLYSYRFVAEVLESQRIGDIGLVVDEEKENLERIFLDAANTAKTISVSLFARQLMADTKLDKSHIDAFNSSGRYLAVYIMDSNGLTLASTDRKLIGQNYGFRKYFTEAKQLGSGFEVSVGVTTGQLGYYVSSSILSVEGVFQGVVVIKIDPRVISGVIEDTDQAGIVQMVTDEFGVVVSSPVEEERLYMSLGKLTPEELKNIEMGKRYGDKKIGQLQYEQVQELLRGRGGDNAEDVVKLKDEEDEDDEWFYLRDILGGKLHLVAEARHSEVTALARVSAMRVGVFFVVIVLMVFVVGGVILGLSLRSLSTIKQMANQISQGGVFEKNLIRSGDEIEELGNILVDLSKKLRLSYEELEKKVLERTKQLEDSKTELARQLEQDKQKQRLLDTQNEKMELTQKAIVNLLEDSREYEKELKLQKEGVERVVAERTKELAAERSRLVASVEALTQGYVLLGFDKKILLTNTYLLEMLGVESLKTLEEIDRLLGDKILLGKSVETCLAGNQQVLMENCEFGAKTLSIIISPVKKDSDGGVGGVLIMVEDVTEKRAIERSKDEFFSIASHELRTPLTAIRGNAAMIKEMVLPRVKDPELEEMIGDIHEGSVRLIGIVNDFLELSRLEQGKLEFKKEVFDLGGCVKKIVDELAESAKTKGIEIRTEGVSETMVKGDSQKAMEVVTNLIGNGIKYTEKGEVLIRIIIEGGRAKVLVKDTGRGIPLANRGLLFRKFQQAGNNLYTRDTAKSTGLGLYISKMMAEGMGGRIYLVKSEENWGSEFAFELPIA